MNLGPDEIQRYSRQMILPEIGLQGQERLKQASVLIVGCGGLGSPMALYLAACGVGRIGIVDYDVVELSNLQRQVIYTTADIGKPKTQVAARRLRSINPHIQVDSYAEQFSTENAWEIAEPYDILIDGTDNIPTRYLMNDVGVLSGKPFVYGAVSRFFGQVSVFVPGKGACYRCIFPTPPPPELLQPCALAGVLGIVPGMIGLLQANEVIKLIVKGHSTLVSHLLLFDALDNSMDKIKIERNPNCKVCGHEPEITHLIDYEAFCSSRVQPGEAVDASFHINSKELMREIASGEQISIIDLREPVEFDISSLPHADNVPFERLSTAVKEWDKVKPIVFVCHFGFLSGIAARILFEEGFENVKSLEGGMQSWYAASMETSRASRQGVNAK